MDEKLEDLFAQAGNGKSVGRMLRISFDMFLGLLRGRLTKPLIEYYLSEIVRAADVFWSMRLKNLVPREEFRKKKKKCMAGVGKNNMKTFFFRRDRKVVGNK